MDCHTYLYKKGFLLNIYEKSCSHNANQIIKSDQKLLVAEHKDWTPNVICNLYIRHRRIKRLTEFSPTTVTGYSGLSLDSMNFDTVKPNRMLPPSFLKFSPYVCVT